MCGGIAFNDLKETPTIALASMSVSSFELTIFLMSAIDKKSVPKTTKKYCTLTIFMQHLLFLVQQ